MKKSGIIMKTRTLAHGILMSVWESYMPLYSVLRDSMIAMPIECFLETMSRSDHVYLNSALPWRIISFFLCVPSSILKILVMNLLDVWI